MGASSMAGAAQANRIHLRTGQVRALNHVCGEHIAGKSVRCTREKRKVTMPGTVP